MKVNLMTIHASKGLEFPVVFIAGTEDDIIPHARAVEEGGDAAVEEERRLFYVAITRARDKLFISACQRRRRHSFMQKQDDENQVQIQDSGNECKPSRFLDEIPKSLVKYHEPAKPVEAEEANKILADMIKKFRKPIVPGFIRENR
ncbi:MAG: ATP-dependent helicase [Treponema sp.]|nr:ATP-dependent helicase [Treponema sp.]